MQTEGQRAEQRLHNEERHGTEQVKDPIPRNQLLEPTSIREVGRTLLALIVMVTTIVALAVAFLTAGKAGVAVVWAVVGPLAVLILRDLFPGRSGRPDG